jgi:hypothetical protein
MSAFRRHTYGRLRVMIRMTIMAGRISIAINRRTIAAFIDQLS